MKQFLFFFRIILHWELNKLLYISYKNSNKVIYLSFIKSINETFELKIINLIFPAKYEKLLLINY